MIRITVSAIAVLAIAAMVAVMPLQGAPLTVAVGSPQGHGAPSAHQPVKTVHTTTAVHGKPAGSTAKQPKTVTTAKAPKTTTATKAPKTTTATKAPKTTTATKAPKTTGKVTKATTSTATTKTTKSTGATKTTKATGTTKTTKNAKATNTTPTSGDPTAPGTTTSTPGTTTGTPGTTTGTPGTTTGTPGTTTGTPGTTGTETTPPVPTGPAVNHLKKQPQLAQKLGGLLPPGTDVMQAASGFKNLGQFVAAVHVSNNQGIPFAQLKEQMVAPNNMSLGQAVQTLKPGTATEVVTTAETQANLEVKVTTQPPTTTSTTTTTPTSKTKTKKKGSGGK